MKQVQLGGGGMKNLQEDKIGGEFYCLIYRQLSKSKAEDRAEEINWLFRE